MSREPIGTWRCGCWVLGIGGQLARERLRWSAHPLSPQSRSVIGRHSWVALKADGSNRLLTSLNPNFTELNGIICHLWPTSGGGGLEKSGVM